MCNTMSIRPVHQGIVRRCHEEVMLNEAEKRIEHINDFIRRPNSSRYDIASRVAQERFKHILDLPVCIDPPLLRKTPSRTLDDGNQSTNCNMVQPQKMRHHCLRDTLSKQRYDWRLRVSV